MIDITFYKIDSWGRAVFKALDREAYFGVITPLSGCYTEDEILNRITLSDISYFGTYFDCEPEGGHADVRIIHSGKPAPRPLTSYSFEELISSLQAYIKRAYRSELGLALLQRALDKASKDAEYDSRLKHALFYGSTLEWRETFSCFGNYLREKYQGMPVPYPFSHAVNTIDTAMWYLKRAN